MLRPPKDISESLSKIRGKVAVAAKKANRSLTDIDIMAVTKYIPTSHIRMVRSCGISLIGENRVQEAFEKIMEFEKMPLKEGPLNCHLIGHLQTNKVKKAVEIFSCIQSLDRLELATKINAEAEKKGKVVSCLVQLKVSNEKTKHGIRAENLELFLTSLRNLSSIEIRGLMTIAPYFENPERARPYFRQTRDAFIKYKNFLGTKPLLSMGMSQDFEVAIEEGSNMIRVGTALFGDRYS